MEQGAVVSVFYGFQVREEARLIPSSLAHAVDALSVVPARACTRAWNNAIPPGVNMVAPGKLHTTRQTQWFVHAVSASSLKKSLGLTMEKKSMTVRFLPPDDDGGCLATSLSAKSRM